MGLIKKMQKQINKFEITGEDLGLSTSAMPITHHLLC
jgi:hypothetical protein